jgi:glycosyltransferase involved in cell wall biosynthesis
VSHVAVDDRYHRAEQVARAPRASLPAEFIFYPANRWKHKNHDGLLRALATLRRRDGLSIHAVFTGYDVANRYPIEQMAVQHGVHDLVHDLGFLTVEELAFVYLKARLMVFPSLYEGFGIPLIEAMAAGCPVVASSHTSIPETVGDAAICFDPAAPDEMWRAIGTAWRDDGLRSRLIERGKRQAAKFSATRMGEAHLVAFMRAIEAYSPRRYPWKYLNERYYRQRAHSKRY